MSSRKSRVDTGRTDASETGRVGAYGLTGLLCAFLLVQTNLTLFPFLTFYDGRRIGQILLLGGLALAILASGALRRESVATLSALPVASRWGLAGLFLLGTVSAARAPIPSAGIREVALFALLLALALAAAGARGVAVRRFELAIVVTLVAAGFIYTVFFLLLRHVHITTLGFDALDVRPRHFFYGWSNARFFGQFAVWVLPLLAAAPLLLRDRTRVARGGAWFVAATWWALILEAGGRGSIIVGVIAVGAAVVALGRGALRWCRDAAFAIGSGTLLWFGATWVMNRVYADDAAITSSVARAIERGPTDAFRPAFWREAWRMIAARPGLGVGPEHYAYYQRAFTAGHPHSAPLQIAAEWGTPAAVIAVAIAGWGVLAWIRRWRGHVLDGQRAAVVPALTAALFGGAALALIDGVIVTPASQVMLAVVAGWMLAVYFEGRHGGLPPARRVSRVSERGFAVTMIALVVALVWTAGPYLWSPTETLAAQLEQYDLRERTPHDPLLPRFWVQGRLFDP